MTKQQAQETLDKIVGQVFGYKNPFTLEQFMQKFAFDVRLPQQVTDAYDGSITWAQSINPAKYIKLENARSVDFMGINQKTDNMQPTRKLNSIEDILQAWDFVNYTTTERVKDSLNVSESDSISYSENVYHSQDIRSSKNILFTDGASNCEFMVASQRSNDSTFGIRIDDSGDITNSFNVAWCGKITNCFFMQDAGDMQDSMFCTNISGKQFMVANMQFDEAEYKRLKDIVIRWILTSN